MVFLSTIPQPGDLLEDSQGQLLDNNAQLDASFGVDHYPFTDTTTNKGKHNLVTTPIIIGGEPTTSIDEPKLYALKQSQVGANPIIGTIQYSKGWDYVTGAPAVPSPVTHLQSPSAAVIVTSGNSTPVLDFTGLTRAMCMVYAFDSLSANRVVAFVTWDGATLRINTLTSGSGGLIAAISTGGSNQILSIQNVSGAVKNVFWTLDMLRLQ